MTEQVIDRPGGTLDSEVLDLASRIFDMARRGDAATLAAYLDAGAPVNLTNTNGDTLVMLAAYYGHESTVAALIARGADVNRHNNRGQTPLAGAVFKNETTIMELLLGADADPLAGSPSALETARFFSKEQLTRQLLQHIRRRRSVNVYAQRAHVAWGRPFRIGHRGTDIQLAGDGRLPLSGGTDGYQR
jgi:ankyrin repeat protein